MSAPFYSPYAPPIQSPYSAYPQPGGGFPGMGLPSQPGGLGQLPQPSGDTFAPGAEAPPPQEAGAPGEGGSQLPTTVFAYKGGFADKNSTLPDGNNAWRNYWTGVGIAGAGSAALAGFAAYRSGRGLGAVLPALNPLNIFKTWKVAVNGGDALRKSVLEGHFPLKQQVLSLASKSKEDAKKLTEEISKKVEAHVNHTKGLFTTTSEEAEKMDALQTAWSDYSTHLKAENATDKTINEKHTSLVDALKGIEKNTLESENNKKPIEAHLNSSHQEALLATKALKPSEGTTLDQGAKQKLDETAAEKLWIWKNSVETLKAPSDHLKKLEIKPNLDEAERGAIEQTLEGLDPLTGAPKTNAPQS